MADVPRAFQLLNLAVLNGGLERQVHELAAAIDAHIVADLLKGPPGWRA